MAKVLTQGTELFVLDETVSPSTVVQIGCPTNYNPGGSTRDQIDTTCLGDTERTYESGLGTPAQETIDIIFDPDDDSHRLLEAMQTSGDKAQFYAGLSDGTNSPTASGGSLIAATSRTGFVFEASVASVSYAAPVNEVWRATVTLQRSGPRVWTYKNP
jgi:hypothetical protein